MSKWRSVVMAWVSISLGNIKLGAIPNVSLPPGLSCGNCKHCYKICYARKAYRRPSVRKSWDGNYNVAKQYADLFWENIGMWTRATTPDRFRIHVSGDILSQQYLDLMMRCVKDSARTQWLCFTKMFSLDYSGKPENLHLWYSIVPGMKELPKRIPGVRFAWLQDGTETRVPADARQCHGYCETCGICFQPSETDIVFRRH